MKPLLIYGILTVRLTVIVCSGANAQGTLGLSNLAEPTESTIVIGSDAWLAIPFYSGDLPGTERLWRIDSVRISMSDSAGSPKGFSVAIYGTLRKAGPGYFIANLAGSDPLLSGIFNYTASDFVVRDIGTLWVVITSNTPVEEGFFTANVASTNHYESGENGWSMGGNYLSSDGQTWTVGRVGDSLQFAIYATPVPKLAITAAGDQIELSWEGFEGVTYQLQTRSSLTDSEWADIGGPLTGDGSELIVPVPVSSSESQSYYRVTVLPAEPSDE